MPEAVVDTNVILCADGKHPDVGPHGQAACVRRLLGIKATGGLVLDDAGRILGEYMKKTRPWNAQTVGEHFLRWALTYQGQPEQCPTQRITPMADDAEDFVEFPRDERLTHFDRADRKFVAVARTRDGVPPIIVAMETDYYMPEHRSALQENGVRVEFICETDLKRVYDRKCGGA